MHERTAGRRAQAVCLVVILAVGVASHASMDEIWGAPLTVHELVEQLPAGLFDGVPIAESDMPVSWCDEGVCSLSIAVPGCDALEGAVQIYVNSTIKAVPGLTTLTLGRAVGSEDVLERESPNDGVTLTVADLSIVQGCTLSEPRGCLFPALAVAVLLEKDGKTVDSLCRWSRDVDELSITMVARNDSGGEAFAFHWIAFPSSSGLTEAFVVTRAEEGSFP